MALVVTAPVLQPDYTISHFIDGIYKVVRFNRSFDCPFFGYDHENDQVYDFKLDPSLSRARKTILEIGLCNRWDWFCTVTLDRAKMDRYDLRQFNKALSQKVRDWRKVYKKQGHDCKIDFLLVPEQHKDGAWHMHGLLRGIPESALSDFDPARHPLNLCGKGYKNWGDYSKHFGFCSLGAIRNPVAAAFYITKYVTEDLNARKAEIGKHLYYASQGLKRAEKVSDVYGGRASLDALLQYHYEFCSTGMTRTEQGFDWSFPLEYDDSMEPLEVAAFDQSEQEMHGMFQDFTYENLSFL